MKEDFPYTFTPGGLSSAVQLLGGRKDAPADMDILVAGSQFGELSLRIADMYKAHVTGIDTDTEAVIYAKMTAHKHGIGARADFRYMEADKLAFPDAAFDVVIADNIFSMFHHRKTLMELRRVMKPGGMLGIMDSYWLKTPVPEYIANVWQSKKQPVLTLDAWMELLAGAGLETVVSIDNSDVLERFYSQFTKDIKEITGSGFEGLKPFKSLVKHFKHEIDVYRKHGGDKYMGHILIRAKAKDSVEARRAQD